MIWSTVLMAHGMVSEVHTYNICAKGIGALRVETVDGWEGRALMVRMFGWASPGALVENV